MFTVFNIQHTFIIHSMFHEPLLQNMSLLSFGRPKGDGEVRLVSNVDKRRQDRLNLNAIQFMEFTVVLMSCHDMCQCCRHIFLFDVAVIVCKRRGDIYEMKEVIDLNHFKITDNPTGDKECRKVSENL